MCVTPESVHCVMHGLLNVLSRERISFLVNPLAAIFSLGFVAAGFVLMVIEERSKNIKHLQLVCGMNRTVYWLSHFTWDLLWFLAFTLLMVILYSVFQVGGYVVLGFS